MDTILSDPPIEPPITNAEELRREYARRAITQRLRIDCPSSGTLTARYAVIAEHPGENEVRLKSPLVGGSGKLLWDVFKKNGYTRDQFYVTNAVKRIVIKSRNDKTSDLTKEELHHWKELLLWEISKLPNLTHVLICGGPALQCVSQHTSIEQWRGSIEDRNGRLFTYTYNPAVCLRFPQLESVFHLDIHKFFATIEGRYKPYSITATINPSPSEAIDFITRMQDEARGRTARPVSFDIETIAGETACIGFANESHSGMCINFRTRSSHPYTAAEEYRVRLHIARLLNDPTVKLIAQNGNFDSYWLWYKDRIRVRRVWFDTMLAHHTLYTRLPHSLAFIVSQYTYHPFYKDEKDSWRENNSNIDTFWQYNVKDCCLTFHTHAHLLRELRLQKLDQFFFSHVMRLNPHLTRMTVNGVMADGFLKDQLTTELRKEVERLELEFHNAVYAATKIQDYHPNPRSPPQLKDLFFNKLQLIGRGQSTDEENRTRMLAHPRTPRAARDVVLALDAYVEQQKFLSTFLEMTLDDDGRVRCEFDQRGVVRAPGRLSSKSTMWGSGTNLQNQPERAKPMYLADPGYCFVYFDMSQIEARIVAYRAVIHKWIEQFERARLDGQYDAHRALAAEMWHMQYEDVPTVDRINGIPTKRYIAKRCRHGLNYRMQSDRLATVTGLSITEANAAYLTYHRITPQLAKWWDWQTKDVQARRVIYNALGRRMTIMGRLDDDVMDSIIAFYPQSTNGDHVSRVIYQSHDDVDWPTGAAFTSINVHDALIGLCRIEDRMRVAQIYKKYAEQPLNILGMDGVTRQLIVPAEFGFSEPDEEGLHRWSTIKKAKVMEAK